MGHFATFLAGTGCPPYAAHLSKAFFLSYFFMEMCCDQRSTALHIQIPHTQRIPFNKRPTRLHFFTHQRGENFIRCNGVFDLHFE
jgi:hypothetical protein